MSDRAGEDSKRGPAGGSWQPRRLGGVKGRAGTLEPDVRAMTYMTARAEVVVNFAGTHTSRRRGKRKGPGDDGIIALRRPREDADNAKLDGSYLKVISPARRPIQDRSLKIPQMGHPGVGPIHGIFRLTRAKGTDERMFWMRANVRGSSSDKDTNALRVQDGR